MLNLMKDTRRRKMINRLPDDIVINDILTRLPVKTLLRFKLVSKLWYFTIQKDAYFCQLHLSRSRSSSSQFLISFYCGIYDKNDPLQLSVLQHAVTVDHNGESARFIGLPLLKIRSCVDGLIVYYTCFGGGTVYFCNPSTKQTITLPQLSWPDGYVTQAVYNLAFRGSYQIGYDSVTKMYKVLYVCEFDTVTCDTYYECWIITIGKDDCWRKTSDLPPYLLNDMHKAYSNGAIHWMNTESFGMDGAPDNEVIVAFDFPTEKFRVIPIPDYIARDKTNMSSFTLSPLETMAGGYLALYDSLRRSETNIVSIWLLQDYVNQVWTHKTFEFPFDDELCHPIGTLPSGEIIMQPHENMRQCWLYYYDLVKNTSRRVEFTSLPSQEYCKGYRAGEYLRVYHFVENLYSWKI